MKSSTQEIFPIIGTAMGGGFYAGRAIIDGKPFALIVAPKAEGDRKNVQLLAKSKDVPAAASWNDGLANTKALAEAGSKLAKWALDLRIGDNDDWYLPSLDELEIAYRNLKPTTDENYVYNRSGLNLSAIDPTRPYALDNPVQTQAEAFLAGGPEAFDPNWYWSSTKHASGSDYAWCQGFGNGTQYYGNVYDRSRARAFRRLPL